METTDTTTSPLKPRRWIAVGAATLALMSAGFGIGVAQAQTSGGDDTTTTEAPDQAPDDATTPDEGERPTDAEIEAFRACMAENGVDLPDERPAPGERPERTEEERAAFEEALTACEDLKPEGFGRHGGPGCDRADEEGDEPTEQDTAATGS